MLPTSQRLALLKYLSLANPEKCKESAKEWEYLCLQADGPFKFLLKKQNKTKQMFNQMQTVLKINLEKLSEKTMHLLEDLDSWGGRACSNHFVFSLTRNGASARAPWVTPGIIKGRQQFYRLTGSSPDRYLGVRAIGKAPRPKEHHGEGQRGSHPSAAQNGLILSAPLHPSSESSSGSLWSLPTSFPRRQLMAGSKLGVCEPNPTHELMPTNASRSKEWMCWWRM